MFSVYFPNKLPPLVFGIVLRCFCPFCFVPRAPITAISPSCLLRRLRVPRIFLDRTKPRGAAFFVACSIFRDSPVALPVAIVSAAETILVMPPLEAWKSLRHGRSSLLVCAAPILVSLAVHEFPWSPLNRAAPRGAALIDTRPYLCDLPRFKFPLFVGWFLFPLRSSQLKTLSLTWRAPWRGILCVYAVFVCRFFLVLPLCVGRLIFSLRSS